MTNTTQAPLESVAPAITLFETEKEIVMIADLPGSSKDSIELEVLKDTLHLRAPLNILDDGEHQTTEVFWKEFRRRVHLGERADPRKVKAKFENGVLTVTVGKAASARPRKVKIS